MAEAVEIRGNKSLNDLGWEALSLIVHTMIALVVLAALVGCFALAHPADDASGPKLLCTALAFLVAMIVGYVIARFRKDLIAQYTWIAGMIMFSMVCVWVLDLPTGNGLCNDCGAVDKLWRTFFSIDHNSGLMGGDGLLIGAWAPLAMIGYSVGAKLGLTSEDE